MRSYDKSEIDAFLHALDAELSAEADLIIIGGVAALYHGSVRATRDIDTVELADTIHHAAERANEKTGLGIPIQQVGIYDGPYEWEDRVRPAPLTGLERLRVVIPERHDLALMKVVRAYEHDLQVLKQMHAQTPFDLDHLRRLFRDEMGHVVGISDRQLRDQFLLLIEQLFGAEIADETESWLRRHDDGQR